MLEIRKLRWMLLSYVRQVEDVFDDNFKDLLEFLLIVWDFSGWVSKFLEKIDPAFEPCFQSSF